MKSIPLSLIITAVLAITAASISAQSNQEVSTLESLPELALLQAAGAVEAPAGELERAGAEAAILQEQPDYYGTPEEAVRAFFKLMSVDSEVEDELAAFEAIFSFDGGMNMPYLSDMGDQRNGLAKFKLHPMAIKTLFGETMKQQKYKEEILKLETREYRRIAQVVVLSSVSLYIDGAPETGQFLTFFQLVRSERGWKITNAARELDNKKMGLPENLFSY